MLGEFKYYDVNVVVESITEKGTVKKNREHHLVWGQRLPRRRKQGQGDDGRDS